MAIGTGYIAGSLKFYFSRDTCQNQKQFLSIGHLLVLCSIFFCYQ